MISVFCLNTNTIDTFDLNISNIINTHIQTTLNWLHIKTVQLLGSDNYEIIFKSVNDEYKYMQIIRINKNKEILDITFVKNKIVVDSVSNLILQHNKNYIF